MKIEINLLPGAKKKKRGGAAFELPDFKELLTQVKDPLLLGTIGTWAVGLAAVGGIWLIEKDRIAVLEPELIRFQQEERQLRGLINERERQEALRDSLVVDLDALREIDGDRYVWPHILSEVTQALPDFTWIVSLDAIAQQDEFREDGTVIPAPVKFSLEGRTSDLQGVTRFLSRLESSPWLRDVRTGGTQTVMEADQPVTSFQVTGTFERADSSNINTVPLRQVTVESN
jgi:Tfp pilus assembly protein PilN